VSCSWQRLDEAAQDLARERVTTAPPRSNFHPGRRVFIGGALAAAAASAAVVIVRPPLDLWPSWSELTADYRTRIGEQRHVVLADSTAIDMNTRTGIAVRPTDDGKRRIELITGEATISTSREAGLFMVLAGGGQISAINARFNVRNQDRTVCVTCLSGDVRVAQGTATRDVPVREQILYSDQGLGPTTAIDPAIVTAWHDGIVIFQSTPVADVIAEVNRYRAGRIILTNEELGRRLFNARLRIANIDRVVGQIEQAFGAKATELPGGIVLLG
jgi:transmembrane sensor